MATALRRRPVRAAFPCMQVRIHPGTIWQGSQMLRKEPV